MADLLDEWIASTERRTMPVSVCNRGDLVDHHRDLVAELAEAEKEATSITGNPEVRRLSEEIVAVEAEMEDFTKTFVLQAVGRQRWTDLLGEHRPTKAERAAGEDVSTKTFWPAAFASCAIDPKVSNAQATAIAEQLPAGEWNKIHVALLALNVAPLPHPKLAAATEIARASEPSSTSSDESASLAQRSSDGSGDPSPTTSTTTPDG
jgi:hypothetical protein